jgi:hypothetical protein
MTSVQIENAHASPGRKSTGDLKISERGFGSVDFCDTYGAECRLTESSTGNAIWLGMTKPSVPTITTMHLSRETVAKLLPRLQAFVSNGTIDTDADKEDDDSEDNRPVAPGQD